MKRVVGVGGIFIKAKDPEQLRAWYKKHLGFEVDDYGGVVFGCPPGPEQQAKAQTAWSLFPSDTKYFDPSTASFMINYRVDNLAALLELLRSEGVTVDDRMDEHEYGKFGWIMDPEGNRIELWEPA
jgi:catechol 2,3-dioxygenase-like lactoylglutathione lyase family enzyme